ncbi:MAG: hypothetical protein ACTHJ7_03475 [Candidatus Nitrosocosmicus sp.]
MNCSSDSSLFIALASNDMGYTQVVGYDLKHNNDNIVGLKKQGKEDLQNMIYKLS